MLSLEVAPPYAACPGRLMGVLCQGFLGSSSWLEIWPQTLRTSSGQTPPINSAQPLYWPVEGFFWPRSLVLLPWLPTWVLGGCGPLIPVTCVQVWWWPLVISFYCRHCQWMFFFDHLTTSFIWAFGEVQNCWDHRRHHRRSFFQSLLIVSCGYLSASTAFLILLGGRTSTQVWFCVLE